MNPTHTPITPGPTPAEILRAAADYIERHGWNQGSYYHRHGVPTPAACALGAITIAAYGRPVEKRHITDPEFDGFDTASLWLETHLQDQHDNPSLRLPAFNDDPHTTAVDITEAMRLAAAAWDTKNAGGDRP